MIWHITQVGADDVSEKGHVKKKHIYHNLAVPSALVKKLQRFHLEAVKSQRQNALNCPLDEPLCRNRVVRKTKTTPLFGRFLEQNHFLENNSYVYFHKKNKTQVNIKPLEQPPEWKICKDFQPVAFFLSGYWFWWFWTVGSLMQVSVTFFWLPKWFSSCIGSAMYKHTSHPNRSRQVHCGVMVMLMPVSISVT